MSSSFSQDHERAITPFRIAVDDAVLDDLKARLHRTRWPEAELVDDWSQGAPRQWLQDVCRYWATATTGASAKRSSTASWSSPRRLTDVDIHFIHMRSPHPDAMPLLITHGWPGSVVEFHKVIEPLVDPTAHGGNAADAFHLVAHRCPGFGFSAKPTLPAGASTASPAPGPS